MNSRVLGSRVRGYAAGWVAVTLWVSALAPAQAGEANDVAARVGEIEIKVADLQGWAGAGRAQVDDLSTTVRREAVRRLVLSQARTAGLDKDPAVQAQITRETEQVLVTAYLVKVAQPAQDFPTEVMIKSIYERNQALFTTAPQVHLKQIFLHVTVGNEAASQTKLGAVMAKLTKERVAFDEVARNYSEHPDSAARGGELDWLGEDQVRPEVAAALKTLKPGEMTAPVRTEQGLHIVQLMARKSGQLRPLPEVRETIIAALRREQTTKNQQDYLAALLKEHPVTVNEIALAKLLDAPVKSPAK